MKQERFPFGRVALVTGASSGIGMETALMLAQKGYSVWALSRGAQGEPRQEGLGRITPLAADVRNVEQVRSAIHKVLEAEGSLGTLVLAAGFGISGPVEDVDPAAAQAQFATNVFGVLHVLREALLALRARGGGTVLVVGSVAGRFSIPFQSHYSASKYALEAFVEALRVEARPFGVRACIIEPGDTKTGFTGARQAPYPKESPYRTACARAVARMEKDEQAGTPPGKAARVIVRMAAKKNPPVRRAVGFSYKALLLARRLLPDRLVEMVITLLYGGR